MIKIYCDGGSRGNPGHAAAAFLVKKEGNLLHTEAHYIGEQTNNVAEYAAALKAHEWLGKSASVLSGDKVEMIFDSELVTKQLRGEYKIKNKVLATYAKKIMEVVKNKDLQMHYRHVQRADNAEADALVNETLDNHV